MTYKATSNGKCINITYKLGKTYTFNGDILLCYVGFHFCSNLENVFEYYSPNKNIKVYEIEVLGNVIEGTNKAVTDKFKLVREVNDADIAKWVKFDDKRNIIYHKHDNGFEVHYEYDENGNIIHYKTDSVFLYDRVEYWNKYDKNGNIIYSENDNGVKRSYIYDEFGKLIIVKLNGNIDEKYEYDKNDRCIFKEDKYKKELNEYDDNGNAISYELISKNNNKEIFKCYYTYDNKGNLIHSKDNKGYECHQKHDNNGNCIYLKNNANEEWWKKYDDKGNVIYFRNKDGCEEWYSYDDEDNLVEYKDSKGNGWSVTIS